MIIIITATRYVSRRSWNEQQLIDDCADGHVWEVGVGGGLRKSNQLRPPGQNPCILSRKWAPFPFTRFLVEQTGVNGSEHLHSLYHVYAPSVCIFLRVYILPCVISFVCISLRMYVPSCTFPWVFMSPSCMALHVQFPSVCMCMSPPYVCPSVCMSPPCICPVHVYVPFVCILLCLVIPLWVCCFHVYVLYACCFRVYVPFACPSMCMSPPSGWCMSGECTCSGLCPGQFGRWGTFSGVHRLTSTGSLGYICFFVSCASVLSSFLSSVECPSFLLFRVYWRPTRNWRRRAGEALDDAFDEQVLGSRASGWDYELDVDYLILYVVRGIRPQLFPLLSLVVSSTYTSSAPTIVPSGVRICFRHV